MIRVHLRNPWSKQKRNQFSASGTTRSTLNDLQLRQILAVDQADGFAARNVKHLTLRESEEMRKDREYLDRTCQELTNDGLVTECVLAGGDPGNEIADAAARENCDLIAMSTHGHKFIKDLLYGSVANDVRHITKVPVLLVRGEPKGKKG